MLKKTNITDTIMLSDEWYQTRLGKFTASENYLLMGEKPMTEGMVSYTYRKVYEELSGLPSKDEVNTRGTEHGHKYEGEGIRAYGQSVGLEFVVQQKLIREPGSRFSATPDFLVIHNESRDGLLWNVTPGEVKCPLGENFIALARCKTPHQVYKVEKKYFWQVIFQMDVCDALHGILVIYNPFVKVGKLNVVEFRKLELRKEFQLVTERKKGAEQFFNEVRDEFLNKQS